MAGILAKLRVLTLGNLHQLLDVAIDINSVAACEQYVRDLEEAKDKMRNSAAEARGRAAQSKAAVDTLAHQIETDTEHAQLLLDDDDPSNDSVAERLMEGVVTKTEDLEIKKTQATTDQATADALGEAVRKITAKHAEMLANVRRLKAVESQAKAQEQATDALRAAAKLTGAAGAVSVDDVAARLQGRAAAAQAKFDDAMGGLNGAEGEVAETVAKSKAKALIAQMRAKKAGQTS